MRIALITKPGHEDTGVGRYTSELRVTLQALGHEVIVVHPVVPLPRQLVRGVRRLLGWDLQEFFVTYPIWARYPQAELYHLTSQNLATLLLLRSPPGPTVVTVHDIIPWLVRKDPELRTYEHFAAEFFDRLALRGLCQADVLIVVSEYTRQTLSELRSGSSDSVAASWPFDHGDVLSRPDRSGLYDK